MRILSEGTSLGVLVLFSNGKITLGHVGNDLKSTDKTSQ